MLPISYYQSITLVMLKPLSESYVCRMHVHSLGSLTENLTFIDIRCELWILRTLQH